MNRYSDIPTEPDPAETAAVGAVADVRDATVADATEACDATIVDAGAVQRVREAASGDRRVTATTAIFSALSDPTRFKILEALSYERLCVCDLAEVAGISQSGVSHQLRVLRDRGLVAFDREGQRAVYRLADDHVRTLIATGLSHADEGGIR